MLEEKIQNNPLAKEPRHGRSDDITDKNLSDEWHYLVARHGYFKTLMFYLVLFFCKIFWFVKDCFEQINYFCHNLLTKNNAKKQE